MTPSRSPLLGCFKPKGDGFEVEVLKRKPLRPRDEWRTRSKKRKNPLTSPRSSPTRSFSPHSGRPPQRSEASLSSSFGRLQRRHPAFCSPEGSDLPCLGCPSWRGSWSVLSVRIEMKWRDGGRCFPRLTLKMCPKINPSMIWCPRWSPASVGSPWSPLYSSLVSSSCLLCSLSTSEDQSG